MEKRRFKMFQGYLITKRYIGISEDEKRQVYLNLNL
jgi:hypothetical protein